METTNFKGKTLSRLGFGGMRFPLLEDGKTIDEDRLAEMVDYAMAHGVNYFDTAWPYHNRTSQVVLGRVLSRYPRESYYLATKYPGHRPEESYDPAATFQGQLDDCGVDYFDFYLLHNVYENSIQTYLDPRWGILDYFREQKRLGRIRHLGFSTHGSPALIREFLDVCTDENGHCDMEFCQIQLNYLDWTMQDAKGKVALLNERNIPIIVMEPVRGGGLCKLSDENEAILRAMRPDEGIPAWGFRFLQDIPGVKVVLSGMSNMAQMQDNLNTFVAPAPLNDTERNALLQIAEGLKNTVPCTACRYCTPHCPMGLDIPLLLAMYNDLRFSPTVITSMRVEAIPADKQPSACIGCGACAQMCPQLIDIPAVMKDFAQRMEALPKWADVCRAREEAAKRMDA